MSDAFMILMTFSQLAFGFALGAWFMHLRTRRARLLSAARTIDAWIHFKHPGPMPDLGPYRSSEAPRVDQPKEEP